MMMKNEEKSTGIHTHAHTNTRMFGRDFDLLFILHCVPSMWIHEMRKCTAILLCCERYKTKRKCGWPARYTMLCMFSLHAHVTIENGSYIISETIDWRKVYLILVVFVVILCMYVCCCCVFFIYLNSDSESNIEINISVRTVSTSLIHLSNVHCTFLLVTVI